MIFRSDRYNGIGMKFKNCKRMTESSIFIPCKYNIAKCLNMARAAGLLPSSCLIPAGSNSSSGNSNITSFK